MRTPFAETIRQGMLRGTRRIRSPLLLACIALSASTGASTTGWVDGPPLPERRWHHAAAASADGYVMAFGGRIYYGPHGRYGHGLGKYGLVFFDPNTQTWERAPRVPPYRERVIVHLSRVSAADRERVTDPSDPRLEETLIEVVNYELPFGGSDAQGRAHYFVGRGSVYFDPHERSWGQAHGPVYHANPAHSESRWTEGTRPSWDSRSLGATATGPDGRLYLVGGIVPRCRPASSGRESTPGGTAANDRVKLNRRGTAHA